MLPVLFYILYVLVVMECLAGSVVNNSANPLNTHTVEILYHNERGRKRERQRGTERKRDMETAEKEKIKLKSERCTNRVEREREPKITGQRRERKK